MPCGKRPLVKKWTKPKQLRDVIPSVLEQNEASVKIHWKKVIRDLELFYKDDQFWESQCETVRELVGPKIFHRLAKIFKLPLEATEYVPRSEHSVVTPSEEYYLEKTGEEGPSYGDYSMSDFAPSVDEELVEDESIEWSMSSSVDVRSRSKSMIRSKSFVDSTMQIKSSKSFSKSMSKSFSRIEKGTSRMLSKSMSGKWRKSLGMISSAPDESAATDDDLIVHGSILERRGPPRRKKNPHFDMLYCNESEKDMIKWNSKYKQKVFEVSASDEFSKKAEIKTKQIAKEFYDWWVSLGNVEFKSEIKRPEDIEDLFQVWFDEHASRSLVLDPKILPCVLQSIANFVGVPRASCPRVLKRQIAFDIHAETSPEHTVAFGTCLPQRMKHIPPKNDTAKMWHCLKIPEDLKSMAAVWDDVAHLTSTKAFHQWLKLHPALPMPPYLQELDADSDKKQPFVVPSDFLFRDRTSGGSSNDLALPVSEFSMELKDVLSKLMNE